MTPEEKARIARIESVLAALIVALQRVLGPENTRELLDELILSPPDKNG